ncbi:MAG: hypothetical protein ABFS42_15800 [Candidatus Krumholzibacteriota bacterium]
MKVSATLLIALPFILIGGIIGALVGGAFDLGLNAIRAGIIVGGIAAFVYLLRKKSGSG